MPNHLTKIVIGAVYGRLTPLRRLANDSKAARWLCRCDCGNELVVYGYRLKALTTRSCGCITSERSRALCEARVTHGHCRKGYRSRTFISYHAMIARCHNPNDPSFFRYGARGISVTKPWRDDFAAFLNDMGMRPEGKSIDRIDNRFGYFMANCRWATWKEQRANQVRNEFRAWRV